MFTKTTVPNINLEYRPYLKFTGNYVGSGWTFVVAGAEEIIADDVVSKQNRGRNIGIALQHKVSTCYKLVAYIVISRIVNKQAINL